MEPPTKLKVDYIKNTGYRTIHVDGAHGGLTPDLNVFAAWWLQRGPIPDSTVHPLAPDGKGFMAGASETNSKAALIREVEFGIVMTLEVAAQVHKWLGDQLQQAEKIKQATPTGQVATQ